MLGVMVHRPRQKTATAFLIIAGLSFRLSRSELLFSMIKLNVTLCWAAAWFTDLTHLNLNHSAARRMDRHVES